MAIGTYVLYKGQRHRVEAHHGEWLRLEFMVGPVHHTAVKDLHGCPVPARGHVAPPITAKSDFVAAMEGAAALCHVEHDPTGKNLHEPGAKADAGKLQPTLIFRDMARAIEAVIKIATDGAAKYTQGGWLSVPNALARYDDADLRHMLKRFKGEPVDADSHSLHLAHEAWNALAKLELFLRAQEKKQS